MLINHDDLHLDSQHSDKGYVKFFFFFFKDKVCCHVSILPVLGRQRQDNWTLAGQSILIVELQVQ